MMMWMIAVLLCCGIANQFLTQPHLSLLTAVFSDSETTSNKFKQVQTTETTLFKSDQSTSNASQNRPFFCIPF
jgi:hypothetical protein